MRPLLALPLLLASTASAQPLFDDVTATHLPPVGAVARNSMDVEAADLDGDGDLDLVQVNLGPLVVLLNDGDGRFSDATAAVLPAPITGPGLGVEIADYNGDGWPDLYVAMLQNADPNAFDRLLLHTGTATGSEGTAPDAQGLRLEAPRPNPARTGARVGFRLERPGPVRIALVDARGREVAVAFDAEAVAGIHEVTLPLGALPVGPYFVRMEAAGRRLARPLAVVR